MTCAVEVSTRTCYFQDTYAKFILCVRKLLLQKLLQTSLQHSGSPEKIWPGIGSSDCTPRSLTRPAQLSRCMSGCVARCSTAIVGQPECGQRDLAWVSLVRGHGTARLPVVSAHCRSLRQLSLLANLHVSDKSNYRDCTQEEEKLYSPSQSCCFLVLLYPPLGHSSIFHPLTCKKTPSK